MNADKDEGWLSARGSRRAALFPAFEFHAAPSTIAHFLRLLLYLRTSAFICGQRIFVLGFPISNLKSQISDLGSQVSFRFRFQIFGATPIWSAGRPISWFLTISVNMTLFYLSSRSWW